MASVGKVIKEMLNESHQGRSGESRMQGGMIAKVVDNVDPEDRYRVRVSFPWLSDQYAKATTSDGSESKVQSHWARITSLMTGGDMGGVWLPEIDDEVMVMFEEGDFGRPIIVGSLWNGEKSSPRKLTYSPDQTEVEGGENNFRFFRSRMGHTFAFIDKEGEGGVSIRSAKSAELYIDDKDGSERIRLYDKEQKQWLEIDTANKKITLETENTGFIYEDDAKLFTNTSTTGITRVSSVADSISGNGYVHIEPVSSNRNTEFTYYLPNTLSGQYDIYVKFLPLQVYDENKTRLPVQFRASLYERSATNGGFPAESKPTYTFMNPVDGKSNFHTNPDRIDSVYVGTYKFQFCYQGTNPGVLFKLESYVLTSQAKSYTKEMLIDKIVLVPSREGHNNDGLYIEREARRR